MKNEDAEEAAKAFRACGWNVRAQKSPLLHIGWELAGIAANDAGRTVYGFSQADMKVLVLGGQVARLPASAAEKSEA